MNAETIYEVDPPSVFSWQPVALLAEALDVSERTIRTWASKGTLVPTPSGNGSGRVERFRTSGRAYYRVIELEVEADGDPPQPEASSSFQSEAPHPELVELTFAWRQETSTLRDRLLEASLAAERAKAEAMEAELLAQVAARDIERFQAELAQAESLIAERNAQIEAQRHRVQMLEKAAALPWYAWRRRRELFAAAERRLLS